MIPARQATRETSITATISHNTPVGHEPNTVIVFERRPRFTPELQRQFLDEDVRVRTGTDLRDVMQLASESTQPVLILDLEADAAGCLQLLARLVGAAPFVPIVCVGSTQSAELEWIVRELGAIEFLTGPISGESLANLCRRQWKNGANERQSGVESAQVRQDDCGRDSR